MPGWGKHGKPKAGFPLFPRAPWKSRQQQARFPHSHSFGHEGGWKSGKPKAGSHFPTAPVSLSQEQKNHAAGSALARGSAPAQPQWSPFPPPRWFPVIPPLTHDRLMSRGAPVGGQLSCPAHLESWAGAPRWGVHLLSDRIKTVSKAHLNEPLGLSVERRADSPGYWKD